MSIRKWRTRLLCIEGLDQRTCFNADCAEAVQVAPAIQVTTTQAVPCQTSQESVGMTKALNPSNVDCAFAQLAEGESSFVNQPPGERYFNPSTGVQNDFDGNGRPDDLPDDVPYQLIPSEGEGESSPPSTPSPTPNVYVFVPEAPKSVTNTNITSSTVTVNTSPSIVVCGSGGGTTVNNYSYGFTSPSCCEPDSDSEKEFEKGLHGMDEKQEQPKAKEKEKVAPETPRKHEECPKTPCPQLFHQEESCPPVWECPPVQQFCPPTYWYPTCTDSNESDAGMLPLPMCAAIVGLPFFGLAKDEDERRRNFHLTA